MKRILQRAISGILASTILIVAGDLSVADAAADCPGEIRCPRGAPEPADASDPRAGSTWAAPSDGGQISLRLDASQNACPGSSLDEDGEDLFRLLVDIPPRLRPW